MQNGFCAFPHKVPEGTLQVVQSVCVYLNLIVAPSNFLHRFFIVIPALLRIVELFSSWY